MNTFNVIASFITFLSFIFGILQSFRIRKLNKIIGDEASELHKNIAINLGACQAAKGNVTNAQLVASEVGKAEGLAQAMLHESAKLVCNLKNTSHKDIDSMIAKGELYPQYKEIYYSFSNERDDFWKKINRPI